MSHESVIVVVGFIIHCRNYRTYVVGLFRKHFQPNKIEYFHCILTARGFGMRVVGGKTGADGRLFAYIVWTVPGGPAEKGGLQQGDKVII